MHDFAKQWHICMMLQISNIYSLCCKSVTFMHYVANWWHTYKHVQSGSSLSGEKAVCKLPKLEDPFQSSDLSFDPEDSN